MNNPEKMTNKEKYQLDFALNRKYCNCIEQVKYNLIKKHTNRNDNSPYGICTNSVYNKRGFKIPKKRTKCKKIYY